MHRSVLPILFLLLTIAAPCRSQDDDGNAQDDLRKSTAAHRRKEHINSTDLAPTGLLVRLSQKGADYACGLVEEALPKLLVGVSLPAMESDGNRLFDLVIVRFDRPTMKAKFVKGKGLRATVALPVVEVAGTATIDALFFSETSGFMINIQNLGLAMDLFFVNRNGTTAANLSYCNVTTDSLGITFSGESSLNTVANMVEDAILGLLKTKLCDLASSAIHFIEVQETQPRRRTRPVSTTTTTTTESPTTNLTTPPPTLTMSHFTGSLCTMDAMDGSHLEINVTEDEEERGSLAGDWLADFSLRQPPVFTEKDATVAFDGGLLLNDKRARGVFKPRSLNSTTLGDKMIGISISEYVPNTFLSHVFDQGMDVVRRRVRPHHLPKPLSSILKVLCSKCYLEITANLTSRPRVEISGEHGARLAVTTLVGLAFQGRGADPQQLLQLDAKLQFTIKPFVRHSRLYGHVALTSVDLNLLNVTSSGRLADPLSAVANFLVPRAVWPTIQKRIRFALNQRGYRLPVLCGAQLVRFNLDYVDGAAILQSDIDYDLPHFLLTFQHFLSAKHRIDTENREKKSP